MYTITKSIVTQIIIQITNIITIITST